MADPWSVDPTLSARPGNPAAGRAKARGPGTALVALGLLSLLSGLSVIVSPWHRESFEAQRRKVQSNPKMTARQKLEYADLMTTLERVVLPIQAGVAVTLSVVMVIGGGMMRKAAGKGWVWAAAVLAVIPGTNACCLLGLPLGVWTMRRLLDPDVQAAFAAGGSPPPVPLSPG